jgi:hypothetical protein
MTCWKRKNKNRWLNHQVRKHGLNTRIRSGCGGGGKGEVRLVKHMSRDQNPTRGELVAAVPRMVREVTKECTTSRVRCELVRSSGSKVRAASAPEDTKVSVSGTGTEESVVRSRSRRSGRRKTVKKVGGIVKALYPEARGQGGLDQKSAHDIVRSPNHALCLTVLWGSIRTRHTQLNTSVVKEGARGVVIEVTTVVTLDDLNDEAELSGHPGK